LTSKDVRHRKVFGNREVLDTAGWSVPKGAGRLGDVGDERIRRLEEVLESKGFFTARCD
jgi:hypothetical protein